MIHGLVTNSVSVGNSSTTAKDFALPTGLANAHAARKRSLRSLVINTAGFARASDAKLNNGCQERFYDAKGFPKRFVFVGDVHVGGKLVCVVGLSGF